jgi:fructosamine-3-kinase
LLPEEIKQACEQLIGTNTIKSRSVSGGSINQAFRLETEKGAYFLKINRSPLAKRMLSTEARGLQGLRDANTIRIPKVLAQDETAAYAYLLLEMIESGPRDAMFWKRFGEELALLHRQTNDNFGWEEDNYIGSLPQSNGQHDNWADFYREERLLPQLNMAIKANVLWPGARTQFDQLFDKLPELCPEEPPALTHGDLWGGNFLSTANGEPVLIDPAVSYAHREMDLAMSKLFGGFSPAFYEAYEANYPTVPGFDERLEVYQLYYLLVHVNLFGGGYVGSTRAALERYV